MSSRCDKQPSSPRKAKLTGLFGCAGGADGCVDIYIEGPEPAPRIGDIFVRHRLSTRYPLLRRRRIWLTLFVSARFSRAATRSVISHRFLDKLLLSMLFAASCQSYIELIIV